MPDETTATATIETPKAPRPQARPPRPQTQAPAPAAPSAPPAEKESLEDELSRLRRENEILRGGTRRPDPKRRADPVRQAPPPPSQLRDLAINDPAPGRTLWLVSVKGHKTLVIDPRRGTPVYLEQAPVWAESRGEAQEFFQAYTGPDATIHPFVIEPFPEDQQAVGSGQ